MTSTLEDIMGTGSTRGPLIPQVKPASALMHQAKVQKSAGLAPAPSKVQSGPMSYADIYQRLNPYTAPTQEEIIKEEKKYKRDQIFNAIGDGISALSNLYFTTRGAPSMYNPKNSMSAAAQIRYDKLKKERDANNIAYFNGLSRAMELDRNRANDERNWKRTLGLDDERRKQYADSIAYRNERDKVADDRYIAEKKYQKAKDEQAQQNWQESFDESKRRANQAHSRATQAQKDSLALRLAQSQAAAARGIRGDQLAFVDGDGKQIGIYENVWKGSMQSVYNAIVEEKKAAGERVPYLDTAQKKEDYAKSNWYKYPKASAVMYALSSIDPASMTSTLGDDDVDLEQYLESNGEEEDFSQYLIK